MKCYINGDNFIRLLLIKLFKFEIQKCTQILCVHKPYFLMPGHIYVKIYASDLTKSSKDTLNAFRHIFHPYLILTVAS